MPCFVMLFTWFAEPDFGIGALRKIDGFVCRQPQSQTYHPGLGGILARGWPPPAFHPLAIGIEQFQSQILKGVKTETFIMNQI